MINYSEALAAVFRERLPDLPIYSNVDPTREFTGEPTIEFIETDAATKTFISGATRRIVGVAVAVRAETQEEAAAIGQGLKEILTQVLDEIKYNGEIEGWTYADEGTTPDARGVATGESFYWYQDFHLLENKEL